MSHAWDLLDGMGFVFSPAGGVSHHGASVATTVSALQSSGKTCHVVVVLSGGRGTNDDDEGGGLARRTGGEAAAKKGEEEDEKGGEVESPLVISTVVVEGILGAIPGRPPLRLLVLRLPISSFAFPCSARSHDSHTNSGEVALENEWDEHAFRTSSTSLGRRGTEMGSSASGDGGPLFTSV